MAAHDSKNALNDRVLLTMTFVCTAVFSILCHGYRYLNAAFSGDATLISQAGEEAYQISIGRFLQPIWWRIRGTIVAPFLIGLFSFFFLSLSSFLISKKLRYGKRLPIILTCGILTASETLGIANATYLPWADVYMVALFFSLLGADLSLSDGRKKWLAPACYLVSLGLYQSYITCAASFIIIVLLCDTLKNPSNLLKIFCRGLLSCLHLLLGLLLYAFVLKIILSLSGIVASQDYNGVGRVGLVSLPELLDLLREAWLTPLRFLFDPQGRAVMTWHLSMIPQAYNVLVAMFILLLVLLNRRLTFASLLASLFFLFVFPLAQNFVMIISKGIINGLMIYSWSFFYMLPVALCNNQDFKRTDPAFSSWTVGLLTAFLLFGNVVSCNQMAFKRDLEFYATQSAFTRILGRMEEQEGYEPGITPVVLIGMLPSSQLSMARSGMEDLSRLQGMRYTYSASYETSQYWYLTMILGAPVNLVPHAERVSLTKDAAGLSLPRFPEEGCVVMRNGILYIRIS